MSRRPNVLHVFVVGLLTVAGLPGVAAPAQAQCFVSDGTARSGEQVPDIVPPAFRYPGKGQFVGAHFDSCEAAVRVVYGPRITPGDHFNIAYGQKPASQGQAPIFSHQIETDSDVALFDTRPREIPVLAFFRIQSCLRVAVFGSECSDWSPNLTVDLGNNELTAY